MTTEATTTSAWVRFWDRGGLWRVLLLTAVYYGLYLGFGAVIGNLFPDSAGGDIFEDSMSVIVNIGGAVVFASILLLAFSASVHWTKAVFGPQPIRGSWWMWILPIIVLLFNIFRMLGIDYASYSTDVIITTFVSGFFIGLAEELLTRGLAVHMLRRAGYKEFAVATLSSLLFAALHLGNIFGGQDVVTVLITFLYTFFFGFAMYFTLRVTGRLIWPILLHGFTDPTAFLLTGGVDEVNNDGAADPNVFASLGGMANIVVIVVGVLIVWWVRGQVDRYEAYGIGDRSTEEPAQS